MLDVAPRGNAFLRLWFSGNAAAGGDVHGSHSEVHLFLNDRDNAGQSEECYLFRVHTDAAM